MKRTVYLIPDCPKCKDKLTGFFITEKGKDGGKTTASYMKRGEYVRIRPYVGGPDMFCMVCGFEWYGTPEKVRLTASEIEDLKRYKGITDDSISNYENETVHITQDYREFKRKNKRTRKAKLKEAAKKWTKNMFTGAFTSPFKDMFGVLKPRK